MSYPTVSHVHTNFQTNNALASHRVKLGICKMGLVAQTAKSSLLCMCGDTSLKLPLPYMHDRSRGPFTAGMAVLELQLGSGLDTLELTVLRQ